MKTTPWICLIFALVGGTVAKAQTLLSCSLLRGSYSMQDDSAAPLPLLYVVSGLADFSAPLASGSTVSISGPAGLKVFDRDNPGAYSLSSSYFSASSMLAAYPDGLYTLQWSGPRPGAVNLTLSAALPNPPRITNYDDAQAITNPENFVLKWAPFIGGTDQDMIFISVAADDGSFSYGGWNPGEPGALPGTATQMAMWLPANKQFTVQVAFFKLSQNVTTYGGMVVFTGAVAFTEFSMQTISAAPASLGPPVITAQPLPVTAQAGTTVALNVGATGETLSYQWNKDGVRLAGATSSTLVLASGSAADTGSYTCTVTNYLGSCTSGAATLALSTSEASRLLSLSVRSVAGTGDRTLIAGFSVVGASSKSILVRGIGPTLAQFGVANALADPELKFFDDIGTQIAQNNDWGGGTMLSNAFATAYAFPLPAGSKDAALLASFPAGTYSAQIVGTSDNACVALLEAYDADSGKPAARLSGVSARNFAGNGDNVLIAGFTIAGDVAKTVLVRAVGPGLSAYGVAGVLANPKLQVYRGSTLVAENDDWGGGTALSNAFTKVYAFPLSAKSQDSALLVTLPPGVYTAQVNGVNGMTGVALVEVYALNP